MNTRPHGKILYKLLGAMAGLVFIVYGMQERSELSHIQKHGTRAVVEPIAQYTEFKQNGRSTYTAELRFKTAEGRQIVTKHSFPEEVLSDFKTGRPVEVFYMQSDPSTLVFASEKASWMLVLAGAVLLIGALLFA
jgi:uncharacterized protein DUF3592